MGLFDRKIGRRDHSAAAEAAFVRGGDEKQPEVSDQPESDADTSSLAVLNEKEVQTNPNNVTANAQLGVQKAEAAALVWSKQALYLTYAW